MNLEKLSARKLGEEIVKRDVRYSASLKAVIAAGFGSYRYADLVEFAKGSSLLSNVVLIREHLKLGEAMREIWSEQDARRRYHGSDKPIKRTGFAA